ncbi:hypothetical protein [Anaerosporobacter faecicola]|uniref:hypothetical protein n=1 Tax=Anaerosporobacter faecicola TaxID=2718714 RepID=UPI001439D19F|nr:hypothetical protein [Anaerosporobacter faecicola]
MDTKNKTMQMQEVLITPEMATELLKSNTCNRVMSKTTVNKYAELMRKGEWFLSHQAIAFADKDDGSEILVDGQHRLAAVIQAEVPIKFTVVKHAVQTPYIDTARNRSFIDNLNIFNDTKKYSITMKGIINLLTKINKINNITQNDRKILCDHYYESFLKVDEIYKKSVTKSGGYPLKAAIFLIYNEYREKDDLLENKLNEYMYIFNTGNINADNEQGMFIKEMRDHYYLQNREFSKIAISNSTSFKRKSLTSIFLYSINCYLLNNRYIYSSDMEFYMHQIIEKQIHVIKSVN